MLQNQVKANWCSKYNPTMVVLGPSISSWKRHLDSISGRIKGMTDRDKNFEFTPSPFPCKLILLNGYCRIEVRWCRQPQRGSNRYRKKITL